MSLLPLPSVFEQRRRRLSCPLKISHFIPGKIKRCSTSKIPQSGAFLYREIVLVVLFFALVIEKL